MGQTPFRTSRVFVRRRPGRAAFARRRPRAQRCALWRPQRWQPPRSPRAPPPGLSPGPWPWPRPRPAAEGAQGEGGRAGAAYQVVPERPRGPGGRQQSQVHVRPADCPRSGARPGRARLREAASPGHSRAWPAAPLSPWPHDPNFPHNHGAGSFRASRALGWVSARTSELGNKEGERAGRGEQRKKYGGNRAGHSDIQRT